MKHAFAFEPHRSFVLFHRIGEADFTGILDLGSSVKRAGLAQKAQPNTNVIVAKTIVPQLRGQIPAGETILVTVVVRTGISMSAIRGYRSCPQSNTPLRQT